VEAFWANAVAGRSAIAPVPAARFDAARYLGGAAGVYSALGAAIPRPPRDARTYGLLPAALAQADPAWFPAVDAAREAVADAGGALAGVAPERIAVVVASGPQREREYQAAGRAAVVRLLEALAAALQSRGVTGAARDAELERARGRLASLYPPVTEDTAAACGGAVLAARVAWAVGAGGGAVVVESACASSLAALDVAAASLARGACDAVVVGGVGDALTPEMLMTFCAFRGLSAEGLFPFDERASGFVLGEGAAFLVLRRAADASAAGARVYAAVLGCGGASDGRRGSAFSPNPAGQAAGCRRALERSGVAAAGVDYLECHGTGTPVGDASELSAYRLVYGERPADRPLVLGTCKSAVGHLNAGAGAVGLLRAALSLRHRLLLPTPGAERPRAAPPLADGRFRVAGALEPWPAPADGAPRRAAVSGFGLGGTSYHAVLEEWRGDAWEPLAPADSPLLDARRALPDGGTEFRRRVDTARELYLRDHVVGGTPALPGAFGCEVMVQAAALALPGLRPVGMEEVRFEGLLQVPEDAPVEMRVLVAPPAARGGGVLAVDVTVTAAFRLPARPGHQVQRRHYRGRVLLSAAPPPASRVAPSVLAASRAPGRDYRTIYSDHSYCHLGPPFQAIRSTVLEGRGSLVARIQAPGEDALVDGCPAPRFHLGPTLFDNYLQAAGTVGVYHNHRFPMPLAIGAATLWERPAAGAEVWASATLLRESGDELFYRIEAFDADGRLHCRCDDFVTRTSQPFSASELVTFYEGLTGGPPEHRPAHGAGQEPYIP
jgi:3-oxoacyl-(acyl-carrier-protein) synthase